MIFGMHKSLTSVVDSLQWSETELRLLHGDDRFYNYLEAFPMDITTP